MNVSAQFGRQFGDEVAAIDESRDGDLGQRRGEVRISDSRRSERNEFIRAAYARGQRRNRGAETMAREHEPLSRVLRLIQPLHHGGKNTSRRGSEAIVNPPGGFVPGRQARYEIDRDIREFRGFGSAKRYDREAVCFAERPETLSTGIPFIEQLGFAESHLRECLP
jgi:hypothetical protein